MDPVLLLLAVLLVAFAFDVTNGMHDTANTVAPLIASRAVAPRTAVTIVAACVTLGALLAGGAVAATIGSGIVPVQLVTLDLVLAVLAGAICWNVLTWFVGIPCSSSLALVGGLVGAGVVATSRSGVSLGEVGWSTVVDKVFVPSFLAPVVGGLVAISLWWAIIRIAGRMERRRANRDLRVTQVGAAMFQAFAQGTNDAQKTMGVVALAILVHQQGRLGADKAEFVVPFWVVLACAASIAIGTLAGGWRIIGTMSRGITRLDVPQGVAATFAGGIVLFLSSRMGLPVSTTYASIGSIMGAGATKGVRRVNWNVAGDIALAWAITVPCSAVVAMGMSLLAVQMPYVVAVIVLGLLAFMLRRNHQDGSLATVTTATPILAPRIVLGRSEQERRLLVATAR